LTKQNRHILFLASWYPNPGQPVLGNFIQHHARAAAMTNTVSVAAAFSHNGDKTVEYSSANNVHEFLARFPKTNGKGIISSVKKLRLYRKALREAVAAAVQKNGKPDVIHIHVAWPVALAAETIIHECNVPVILSEHWSGYLPEDGNYSGMLLKHYTSLLFSKVKLVTVVSDRMQQAMEKHGLHGKFKRLPNAVDSNIFTYKPQSTDNTLRWLHVSMLVDREKNIRGLIRAFAKHSKEHDASLTIVGEGNEKNELMQFADSLGLNGKVQFTGLRSPNEIAVLMNTHSALVMFSNFEGMPVTIIEAKCCGLPVIATHTGAIPEMLNHSTDQLVPVKDELRLTQAMNEFASKLNSITESDKLNISTSALSVYSYQAVNKQFDSLYTDVLSNQ
jgi:glycosyltransferase involved in cell wall biosynthesis